MIIMLMHAIIKRSNRQKQKMKIQQKTRTSIINVRSISVLAVVALFTGFSLYVPFVRADSFDEKINALNGNSNQKKQEKGILGVEASSLSDAIYKLQAEIDSVQSTINENEAKMASLQGQIKAAEDELARQKDLLSQTIRQMYLEGDISTVEMLATSKNLSDFFDKQQYRESVQSKIKTTLDKITVLKQELSAQKTEVERLLAEQKQLRSQLASQRVEKDRVLALNQQGQSKLEGDIKANNSKVTELKKQQIAANARFIGGGISGATCGGGYPQSTKSKRTGVLWGCNHPHDNTLDDWGMYNRECVSYTAFKAEQVHGYRASNFGNANQWDESARNRGLAVDSNPQVGDVAVSNSGFYGHVMYVEAVNGNSISISQYNADLRGTYSTKTISKGGLVFIHF